MPDSSVGDSSVGGRTCKGNSDGGCLSNHSDRS